jgi:tRNA threonylcarbamoyladenosine biosynthesis protein TsaE
MVEKKIHNMALVDEKASQDLGKRLASCIEPPLVLTFSGELGAGKTTIIRALLQALGVGMAVKSPTFSLVESYSCNNMQVHHFDLYRITHPEELDYIGFRDYFSEESLCCIEWPSNAEKALPAVDLSVQLTRSGMGRSAQLQAQSLAGEAVLHCILGI